MSEQKQLEILVVEDTPLHQESAREQFKDCKLKIAANYEEAKRLLTEPKYDELKKAVAEEAKENKQWEEYSRLLEEAKLPSQYNVVLADLLMPKGSSDTMGPEGMKYILDLLPYGFPLAFLAAKQGVPYIGVVTDVNHHHHPMSACIDPLSSAYWNEGSADTSLFTVNKSVVGIFHAPFVGDDDLKYEGESKKDWKKVLGVLMGMKGE